jgi:hypothetical protein
MPAAGLDHAVELGGLAWLALAPPMRSRSVKRPSSTIFNMI